MKGWVREVVMRIDDCHFEIVGKVVAKSRHKQMQMAATSLLYYECCDVAVE